MKSKSQIDHGRGQVKDNAMAALVTSKVFRPKSVKPSKGKGSFKRQAKHKGRDFRPDSCLNVGNSFKALF